MSNGSRLTAHVQRLTKKSIDKNAKLPHDVTSLGLMFITISYDITDNRRRQRLAKMLSNYGHRVQKSVFECRLDDRQYLKLKKGIEEIIDWDDDSVRYYFLCQHCTDNIEISGWGVVRDDEDVIVV